MPGLVKRKCKIICTIGPKVNTHDGIKALSEAGMNVARLNFSHGSYEYFSSVIENVRSVAAESKQIISILLDTKGPEIRTGKLQGGTPVFLEAGASFELHCGVDCSPEGFLGDATKVGVDYGNMPAVMEIGKEVLVDDGLIALKVTKIEGSVVTTVVQNSGELGETKGVNLPGVSVDLPAVTEKDKKDILFGVDRGVDFIAASFVRTAANVREIRSLLGGKGRGVRIIAKIENQEGLDNFDAILHEADGVMVARGDLGVEIPIEKVFRAQKEMIRKCNYAGKLVITATQMLESMIENPRPTRAECTDVGNAVYDGTDCVMLSGETAKGKYPVEAVTIMSKICIEAEQSLDYQREFDRIQTHSDKRLLTVPEVVCASAVKTAHDVGASIIVTLTETGRTAKFTSKYRPRAHILCITANAQVARQAMLLRGVYPMVVGSMIGTDSLIQRALEAAKIKKLVQVGNLAVVVSGMREAVPGTTNSLRVITIQ